MIHQKRILALSFAQGAIEFVEGVVSGKTCRVTASGRLEPGGVSSESSQTRPGDPAVVGRLLRDMLRARGVKARRCIVGLGAVSLATRDKRMPAAAAAQLVDALRMATEHDFAASEQDLLFDFVPSPRPDDASALLVAASKATVDASVAVARAASLNVVAVTSGILCLAATAVSAESRLILSFTEGGAEMVLQSPDKPPVLRWLPAEAGHADWTDQGAISHVETQLRRILMSLPGAEPRSIELALAEASERAKQALAAMGERVGVPARVCAYSSDAGKLPPQTPPVHPGTVAMLVRAAQDERLPLDLLHSRLSPPVKRRLGRLVVWSAAAAAVIVALCLWAILDWRSNTLQAEELDKQLKADKTPAQQAKDLVDRTLFARAWFDKRPKIMDCLRELTLAFPEDNRIWATNLAARDDMHAVLTGKAVNESAAIDLLDRLKARSKLTQIKPLYVRQATGSREASFAFSMTYVGVP